MRIAFDALPLLGRKTGIGYCEAGQVTALARLYPEYDFVLNYFAMKDLEKHKQEMETLREQHKLEIEKLQLQQ
ncbi:MAG: hypothetical protein K2J25_00775, partial [Oscillospiraceae bacterium]|nr:hypothetical protein [Oscillospiraceae bacterium]